MLLKLWIALKFFVLLQSKQRTAAQYRGVKRCELLSNFLYFCSRNNCCIPSPAAAELWIALKFFVLLQSKQHCSYIDVVSERCELLSNFLYFCSRNNYCWGIAQGGRLWIALKFFVLLQSKQHSVSDIVGNIRCELLSNFLYFCSRNNYWACFTCSTLVVNCSQIFCTFAVETTRPVPQQMEKGCELLSNFLYFCSRNNLVEQEYILTSVVNCSQIFCTFAVETTDQARPPALLRLWIALKFFVLLQSKQPTLIIPRYPCSCELLSNFLYFCSRNNVMWILVLVLVLWIALKFFVLLQSKQQSVTLPLVNLSCELLSNFLYFCSRNNYQSEYD